MFTPASQPSHVLDALRRNSGCLQIGITGGIGRNTHSNGEGCTSEQSAGVIKLAKGTAQYRAVRRELEGPTPSDVWFEAGLWFVVFETIAAVAVIMFVVDYDKKFVNSVQRVSLDLDKSVAQVTVLSASREGEGDAPVMSSSTVGE